MSEARVMEVRIKKQGVTRWWIRNQFRNDNMVPGLSQQVV